MKYTPFVIIAILMFACNAPKDKELNNRITFENSMWEKGDAKTFKVYIDPEHNPHYMAIVMNSNEKFPHPLLRLRIQEKRPNGELLEYDFELNMQIREDDMEEIQQRGGKDHLVIPSFNYTETGEYSFTVSHSMAEQSLLGLENMELVVKPVNAPNP